MFSCDLLIPKRGGWVVYIRGEQLLEGFIKIQAFIFLFYYSATVAFVFNNIKELWGFWTSHLSSSRAALLAKFYNWVMRPLLGLQRVLV